MVPKTTESFIQQAKTKHGEDIYNYEKTIYIHSAKKLIVTCKLHGDFLIQATTHISKHTLGGCPKCSKNPRYTLETFIAKANEVHKNKYDYNKINYKNNSTKIEIICKEHGEFFQTPNSHLIGQGCSKCSGNNKSNTDLFIKKAKLIHGDTYDYSKTIYKRDKEKLTITCKLHGDFLQLPSHHHSLGHGCPKCKHENTYGVINRKSFEKWPELKLKDATLYLIKLFNNNECFYKIGITRKSIEKRFINIKKYYNYEIIYKYKSDLYTVFWLEQEILKEKQHRYIPKISFGGQYECFNRNMIDYIFEYIRCFALN